MKKAGVPQRAIVILEGEALLNDATALVLLRTAVAAALGTFSLGAAIGTFAYAVVVAIVIGGVVGVVTVWLRARIEEPALATIVSFTVPFVASVPAEALHASGLVAAVVAGLVTSLRGAGSASHRCTGCRIDRTGRASSGCWRGWSS
ncbi:cation:proton antiporter domain-containing protein [Propioniciclava flava]